MSPGEISDEMGPALIRNYAVNLCDNRPYVTAESQREDLSILTLPRAPKGTAALVIGSGPSLDDAAPYLSKWDGAIFASLTNLSTLRHAHVDPTYVVIQDSDPNDLIHVQHANYSPRTVLLTHPAIDPGVLQGWKGPKRYFLQQTNEAVFNEVSKALYPWFGISLLAFGCVTNTAVNIAQILGYNPIILAGVDYGSIGSRHRCTSYRYLGPYLDQPEPAAAQPMPADVAEFYHLALLMLWKFTSCNLISCSRGLNLEIPYMPPDHIIKTRDTWPHFLSSQRIAEMVDAATIPKGAYAAFKPGPHIVYQKSDESLDDFKRRIA